MAGILEGLGVIAVVVGIGYLLALRGVLGAQHQRALSQVVFYVGAPAILFLTLASADVASVLSSGLLVTAVTSTAMALTYALVALLVWRRPVPPVVVGALASSYVNAGNLGIPITVYVLGDARYVAPVMLFQFVVIAPVAFAVLDAAALGRRPPLLRIVSRPLTNPVTVGSALGLVVAAAGWDLPTLVAEPLLAYALARVVLGLEGTTLLAVTLCAALPTAQNVFVYAVRYDRAVPLARDAIAVTTPLSVPVMLVVTAVLAPR